MILESYYSQVALSRTLTIPYWLVHYTIRPGLQYPTGLYTTPSGQDHNTLLACTLHYQAMLTISYWPVCWGFLCVCIMSLFHLLYMPLFIGNSGFSVMIFIGYFTFSYFPIYLETKVECLSDKLGQGE